MENGKNSGLTQKAADDILAQNGLNEVQLPTFNFWKAVSQRLWEPSAWVLEAALILEIILGRGVQAVFIILMLLFAAINGAVQSRRASSVLNSLSEQLEPMVSVKRDNKWQQIPSKDLVVGDLISLRQGDLVPADAQLISSMLDLNESSITGESKSVHYEVGQTVLAGTEVLSGSSQATVLATGSQSRYGKTVSLINTSSAPGHLQILLGKIIGYLAILDAILAVILIVVALLRHENLIEMLPFLAMLFIATIPIAMPSSFAVANSVEAKELSKRKVLVSDLSGIQEAANMNLLLVDKTGTITANRPEVVTFKNLSNFSDQDVIQWAVQATDFKNPSVIDLAVQKYGKTSNVANQVLKFEPFSSERGYSVAKIDVNGESREVKLGSLKQLQSENSTNVDFDGIDFEAGRSVAVSFAQQLVGVFIMQDQPRPDSLTALEEIQNRGVKVIMLTGDNQLTATAVAEQVHLPGTVVTPTMLNNFTNLDKLAGIAEVRPENKLAIVQQFQKAGYIVGMTGDGVNDAPALKQAEVGIAVENAVDLAKRSAKMVLMSEGLTPIIEILDSGHRVYQRMMTWTITKLSRTAELTILLTLGYLLFKFIPLSINAMILVAILNDLVTLVLGTDRTTITKKPENWNIGRLSINAGILALGWTLIGMLLLRYSISLGIGTGQASTILYVYLIFSAMLTILITRTTTNFWRSLPSKLVIIAVGGNILLTIVLAVVGIGITSVSGKWIVIVALLTLFVGVVLDVLYRIYSKIFSRKQS